ncbi:MAG: Yip1 family protein, partial [bacterium]
MIKIFDRLNKKKALATFLAVSLMVVIAFWGREVGAEDAASTDSSSKLAMIVSWLIYPFVYFAGFMVGIMVKVMLWIATYNNFLNVPVVESGWVIVRDLCNNAFIIVMLLMALSTVLDQKAYHYKSILPKVIMTAILVNFSKMITGIAIDFSQILLLTFAAPLAQTSGQNILLMALGLSNSLSLTKDFVAGGWGMVVALIVGLLVGTVSFVVIGVIAIMLLARLITLWFLVILSPLYFLSQMIPQLSTISKDWSSKLRANLITGPIMMFFVYLSFATLSGMAQYNATTEEQKPAFCAKTENTSSIMCSKGDKLKNGAEGDAEAIGSTGTATTNVALSKLASPEGILSSMVVIGMLIMSLKMGQDLGAAGAGVAKSVLNKGREFVDNQRKKYLDRAKGVASSTWGVTKGVGVGIDKMAGGHISGTFGAAKSMAKGAALGAAAGSVIPGLGTTAGLLVGAFGNPFTRLGLDKLKLGERLKSKRAQDERLLAASNEGTQTRQESIKANAGGPGKDKEHTYNEKLGGYVFADAGGKKYMLDKNGQSMEANAAGEIPEEDKLKRNITVEAGDRGGMVDKNGQAIAMKEDGSGPIDAAAVRSAYKWNDSARAFIDDDGKVYQKDGKVVQRYNEYTDEKGNRFARGKKDQQYKQIDERGVLQLKNDAGDPGLILTNDGTLINERGDKVKGVAEPGVDDKFKSEIAKGTLLGNEITTIGGAGKRFVSAYQASTNKTKNITEEAEDKNISDAMKELKGLNKEMLQNLFDMEKDATKRQAIALQLAIKNGFNSKASMERARDSISNDIT